MRIMLLASEALWRLFFLMRAHSARLINIFLTSELSIRHLWSPIDTNVNALIELGKLEGWILPQRLFLGGSCLRKISILPELDLESPEAEKYCLPPLIVAPLHPILT